jgi:hypothetical protein
MDTIKVSLELDPSIQKALGDLVNKGSLLDKGFKQIGSSGSSAFSSLALQIGRATGIYDIFVGNLAANLTTKLFETVTSSAREFFNASIDGAAEADQNILNMNVALKSAGLLVNNNAKDFEEFASSIQKVTKFSDDAVLSSITLLANLTNLNEDGIKKATTAATDLAATLNISLADATEMIAKAVNGNVTAFQKKGIAIEKADTTAERLTNTLAALSTQQGKATDTANSYAGATAKSTNQQGELFEAIGRLITQNPLVIAGIKAKASAYGELAEWIKNNTQFIYDLGTAVTVTASLFAAGTAALYVYRTAQLAVTIATLAGTTAFQALGVYAAAAWTAITAPISLTILGITAVVTAVYQLVKNWDSVKVAVYNAGAATLEYAAKALAAIGGDVSGLKAQAALWREKATAIKEATTVASDASKEEAAQADLRRQKLAQEAEDIARVNTAKSELARANIEELSLIEQEKNLRLDEINNGYNSRQLEKKHEHERQLLEIQINAEVAKAQLETDAKNRREGLEKLDYKNRIDRAKLNAKQEEEIAKAKIQNQKDTFSTISTLSSSNNKVLAGIGKAAGITQIAIDTPVAVSKALAAAPPPFNFVLAGLVGAAMAAQAAKIAGVQFAQGGIVPGTSFTGDRVIAGLNSREMVLNTSQQAQLFELANGRGNSNDNGVSRDDVASMVSEISNRPIIVQVDGKELINITRAQLASGRSI